jgi:hypothetical protein
MLERYTLLEVVDVSRSLCFRNTREKALTLPYF